MNKPGYAINRLALIIGGGLVFAVGLQATDDLFHGAVERRVNVQSAQAATDLRHGAEEALISVLGIGLCAYGIRTYKSHLEY